MGSGKPKSKPVASFCPSTDGGRGLIIGSQILFLQLVLSMILGAYDHYGFAFVALVGTFVAAAGLLYLMSHARLVEPLRAYRGVVPPFINIIGVLFALTLAFLANDTWSAHDRAFSAVYREADSLRSIQALSLKLPEPIRLKVNGAITDYVRTSVEVDWPLLAKRESSRGASVQLDALLSVLAGDDVARVAGPSVHTLMLRQAIDVREARDLRIALSQTHVNPLKWLGMAFLGFLTMLSVAVVHIDQPRAAMAAVLLFAVSAAPTAAIVLVQGNPFQQPTVVTPAPLQALLEQR